MNKLYVVMPVYNEEAIIASIVDEWHKIVESVGGGSKLVLFNDGSRDNTSEVLKSIKNKYPDLIIMDKENTGHGPTCILAYRYAIAEGADWVFQTDSDGQTKSGDFWLFWERRNLYDFIIGFRAKRRDSLVRRFISQMLRLLLLVLFGVNVKDANAPFRLMKVERLRGYMKAIPVDYFIPNILLSVMITKNKENVAWPEITFHPRTSGVSSIPLARLVKLAVTLTAQLYKMKNLKP